MPGLWSIQVVARCAGPASYRRMSQYADDKLRPLLRARNRTADLVTPERAAELEARRAERREARRERKRAKNEVIRQRRRERKAAVDAQMARLGLDRSDEQPQQLSDEALVGGDALRRRRDARAALEQLRAERRSEAEGQKRERMFTSQVQASTAGAVHDCV